MPTITGTAGSDTISGTSDRELIYGLDGNDRIFAGDGIDELNDDTVFAGLGDDIIHGGAGGDWIYDEAGNDIVAAGDGRDTIFGSSGDDTYDGGSGYDILNYSSALAGILVDLNAASGQVRSIGPADAAFVGVDTIYNIEYIGGSNYDDRMIGDGADNRSFGGGGNDTLLGGGGNDELLGGAGNDLLDGGMGFDQVLYSGVSGGVSVSLAISGPQDTGDGLDTLVSIEGLLGTYYADVLTGNDQANLLVGDPGDDRIDGGGGDDFIEGGSGFDILTGGGGFDTFRGDSLSLNGDIILDFSRGDRILLPDAYPGLAVSLSGNQLTLGIGTLTLSNSQNLSLTIHSAPEGGIVITFDGPPIIFSPGPPVPEDTNFAAAPMEISAPEELKLPDVPLNDPPLFPAHMPPFGDLFAIA